MTNTHVSSPLTRTTRALALGFTATMALAGCGTLSSLNPFEAKRVEYRTAAPGAALEVPPDLAPPKYDERFKVGGVATLSGVNAQTRAATLAGSRGVLPTQSGIRIERAGTERWLVVNQSADEVFTRLRDFWTSLNLNLVLDDPRIGVMETDWAENRARIQDDVIRRTIGRVFDAAYSSGTRDKYRVRIERVSPSVTEIYVSHRGMEEKQIGNQGGTPIFRWEPRKPEPEFEAEILARLMFFLGTQREVAQQLAASATGAPVSTTPAALVPRVDQASIVKNGKISSLSVEDGFDRAWRRVGLALDRVGFTVVDRDRNAGTYFVRYADPDSSGKRGDGVLDRLKFWQSDSSNVEQFRITLKEAGGKTAVNVLDKNGQPEESTTGTRIVTLLHEQLK
jgi:outer membrane protein assembly factor BamC